MQDIKLKLCANGLYDLIVGENGDFETVDGLETTLQTLIFTDERAPASLVPDAAKRRGHPMSLSSNKTGTIGSIAWVYEQARNTQQTRNGLKLAVQDALSPLVKKKIVKQVAVEVKSENRSIVLFITITTSDNTIQRYNILWDKTDAF